MRQHKHTQRKIESAIVSLRRLLEARIDLQGEKNSDCREDLSRIVFQLILCIATTTSNYRSSDLSRFFGRAAQRTEHFLVFFQAAENVIKRLLFGL